MEFIHQNRVLSIRLKKEDGFYKAQEIYLI